jgi:hypothetical protein
LYVAGPYTTSEAKPKGCFAPKGDLAHHETKAE